MAHRDGHQAALLRAEALERELAEAKEALAEKERELAARRATDEGGAAEPSGTADPNASLAQLRIDAGRMAEELEAKGAKEAEERVRSEAANDRAQERERRRRIVRSASAFGFLFTPGTLLLALPVFAMTTYAAGLAQLPIRFSIAVGASAAAFLLFGAFIYAPLRAKRLPRWIASLPYAVPNYMQLMAQRAPEAYMSLGEHSRLIA